MNHRSLVFALSILLPSISCLAPRPDPSGAGGAGGAGGESGGGAAVATGTGGSVTSCEPGSKRDCYTGPAATRGVGACMDGFSICNPIGTDWGFCEGEITPGKEICTTPADDDCDGTPNDGCL